MAPIAARKSEYLESCARLDSLEGVPSDQGAMTAASLRAALALSGRLCDSELDELMARYGEYEAAAGPAHGSASSALAGFASWALDSRDDALRAARLAYAEDEAERRISEARYLQAYSGFLEGLTDEAELLGSAAEAYGIEAASGKRYLGDLADAIGSAALGDDIGSFSPERSEAARRYAGLVGQALDARFLSELAAREAEWGAARLELYEKRLAWREAGALILERGRKDFALGFDLLRERFASWNERYAGQRLSKEAAWDYSYYDMLGRKLEWAARATSAAGSAASGAVLALVGADAEASARSFDAVSVSAVDLSEGAREAYDEVVSAPGIARMPSALGYQYGSALTAARSVRSGVGGLGTWDSGTIRVAAADFARRSGSTLAGIQARLMAVNFADAASAAVAGLEETVRAANDGFDASMNDAFVADGKWRREGGSYTKDVVVHSTLGARYITDRASVQAYSRFSTGPWSLGTDISEGRLSSLDARGVRALVSKAQDEVRAKSEEVFGKASDAEDAASIASRTRSFYQKKSVERRRERDVVRRGQDGEEYTVTEKYSYFVEVDDTDNPITKFIQPGLFGAHIGYDPIVRNGADPEEGEAALFLDSGSGELGRLLRSYIFWSMKEGKGWYEANKPAYEKDLWDDRGSWFQAPTLRGLADIGVGIAAAALSGGASLPSLLGSAAINLGDDALFGALDVGGGYRSWEEAGLAFGKRAASSAVAVIGGQAFGSVMGSAASTAADGAAVAATGLMAGTGIGGAVSRTIWGGMQNISSSLATSAIDAVTLEYDTDANGNRVFKGLGWSGDAFRAGVGSGLASALSGAASGLTSGALSDSLEGFAGRAYSGGAALSEFVGGLAGQGVQYGLTGRASLNLLNVGMLGATGRNGNLVSSGLLELNIGAEGAGMAIGAGGMDASLGAIAAAASGLEAWGVNARLALSGQDEARRYASAMRSLYSAGGPANDERNLFERILLGQTDVVENPDGDYGAVTEYDAVNGTHTIVLGRDALRDGSRFGMNILLAHEAYRNGIDDGERGQALETYEAALGHMGSAARLGSSYGLDSLNEFQRGEVAALGSYLAGESSLIASAMEAYESSDDYWKLLKDGRLINDMKARILVEITNDDGSTGWKLVEGSEKETSVSESLVHYLGEARTLELLGGSFAGISSYDDETLRDVLNLDDVDIKAARSSSGEASALLAAATESQRHRLLGEALMKNAGISWRADEKAWLGEGSGLTLTDGEIHGAASLRSIGGGAYERFSITSEITRYEGAYDVWIDGVRGEVGSGNTSVSFTKWDIDSGERIAAVLAGGAWNSVDNSYGQLDSNKRPIGTDKRYQIAFGPTLQANTIARGPLALRWAIDGSGMFSGEDVFIISGTSTIAGETIGPDGRRPGRPTDYRWLMHSTTYGSSDGCIVYKKDEEFNNRYKLLVSQLQGWGLYQGYAINSSLNDLSSFPYRSGYKKGLW
ncbi:MAG: hypothetical protein KKA67_05610 [Spirochaetes bacterium]|nr:hypothetical protein [Spirochaetota bacterium]